MKTTPDNEYSAVNVAHNQETNTMSNHTDEKRKQIISELQEKGIWFGPIDGKVNPKHPELSLLLLARQEAEKNGCLDPEYPNAARWSIDFYYNYYWDEYQKQIAGGE